MPQASERVLTAEVNRILAELKTDGTMDKLSEKYGVNLAK